MIHLFINGIAASTGGGLTYLRNVLPHLAIRDDVRTTVLLNSSFASEFHDSNNLEIVQSNSSPGAAKRFWYEQHKIPKLIRESNANCLLSPGNFVVFGSPVPQILLSRNALYTSRQFTRDLYDRGEYGMLAGHAIKSFLARKSMRAADCAVAPTAAFAKDLQDWTGQDVEVLHHGFNPAIFFCDVPLQPEIQRKLDTAKGSLRLLFVSHYNYYRNFETLIRGLAVLKRRLAPRTVKLLLTCRLESGSNPGGYRSYSAAALARHLQVKEDIVELGPLPYRLLHHLYCFCDLYVTAAYAESFAHPLVEAMASGIPVIASDLPVHREICGSAAQRSWQIACWRLATLKNAKLCSAAACRARSISVGRSTPNT